MHKTRSSPHTKTRSKKEGKGYGTAQKEQEKAKKYEEYVKTDEYIKETAEDKLNLVDPNEILFRPAQ